MNERLRLLALSLFALTPLGCSEPTAKYGDVSLTALNNPPGIVSLEDDEIGLSAGAAAYISTRLESRTDENYPSSTELDMRSRDPEIFQVYNGEGRAFVLIGIAEGTSCLEIVVNNTVEDCIDVVIGERAF